MTPQAFIAKWRQVELTERSACQQHFLDLCDLLGQEKPAAADPAGAWYCFERGVSKTEGGHGWADVWMRGHFGWEYKGKHKDLSAAYKQLLQYRESLENPPLLVVCDLDRFEIHTNFTDTIKRVYDFDLASLDQPKNLETLRRVFTDPDALRPGIATRTVTSLVSEKFGLVADAMRQRKIPPQDVAHFLMKLMFSMFVEDIELLPNRIFARTLKQSKNVGSKLSAFLRDLFAAMADGGTFGPEDILHFNGGLFADSRVYDLLPAEIQHLTDAADQNWSSVEPHIFGTLFERLLDPEKRSQIGAHYTSSDDIKTLLEPVMMTPLRREWSAAREKCDALIPHLAPHTNPQRQRETQPADTSPKRQRGKSASHSDPRRAFEALLTDFAHRLAAVTVLDPACGSGNFLYVALRLLLDLEKEVITYAANHNLILQPQVRPTQLHGIEINPYAQELASVVIWIGYLQWMRDNGFTAPNNPVLEPIESIERRDAILDLTNPKKPKEPTWPPAEFIVGNPPFLGDKMMRGGLGDDYVNKLRELYTSRIPGQSDLCCYWFERARRMLETKKASRVGLLATQGIRGGANRTVVDRILESGNIFFAVSDRDWILDGAHVHVSMIGFDGGSEEVKILDSKHVQRINANLTSYADITSAQTLKSNAGTGFIGTTKKAPLDIEESLALSFLKVPNPSGRPNSDVVLPFANGMDITTRFSNTWIVNFEERTIEESAPYERPFEFVRENVYPLRKNHREPRQKAKWWLLARSCPEMSLAISRLPRFLATPRVSKHRLFAFVDPIVVPDCQLVVFARDDDYLFGVLQSRLHEVWSLSQGTQLREKESGFRYTPTTCFETFPFPEPTDDQRAAIAEAARELDSLRTNWLNPPEWTHTEFLEFPGTIGGPWSRYIDLPKAAPAGPDGAAAATTPPTASKSNRQKRSPRLPASEGLAGLHSVATVRYPRLLPNDAAAAKELKKRTLTNLYNARPAWLALAHQKLDAAVFAAYGWPAVLTDDDLLSRLLALNLSRAST